MQDNHAHPILGLVFFALFSIPFGVTAYLLAQEKGRNAALWTILGVIPVLNIFCLYYFMGAVNMKLERKVDELIELVRSKT